MDFLSSLFLETPWQLGIFSFLLFAFVLLYRKRMQSEAWRRRSLPLALMVIVDLFVLQTAVVTERERILDRLDQFVAAIEAPNGAALAGLIATDYASEGFDRDAFIEALDRWLAQIDVHDTRYRRRDVDVDGATAEMTLGASATVHRNGGTGEQHWGRWKISWVKETGEWRIRAIRIEMLDAMDVDQMRSYLP
ncbi:MAG: nuclear transport factor 2 family protein [Phycisphaerales bacterium]|nr:nuclear transport factor 2 family protein [Phycisphaerales bacterium]MCB9855991.1 nuclear transport factor 2 family protein [Phycisphaerales bacterium]MCB9864982.1 nuclear transport factor 2 family protein [Phycisphaerales bacterium]